MKKIIVLLFLSRLFFLPLFAQKYEQDKLRLEVRCYDQSYDFDPHSTIFDRHPRFILGIQNVGNAKVFVSASINVGLSGIDDESDVSFELYYLKGNDTLDVLKNISSQNIFGKLSRDSIHINSSATFFFEFDGLGQFYLKRSGEYLIRFTLLKKYAPQYMTKNVTSSFARFHINTGKEE